jgi:NAD-dependent SIR2 family protein deacetylase
VELGALTQLLHGRRVVALTGAGCSTESGIPDYRGPDTPPRTRPPIQHREFVDRADARRRYWARSVLGWSRFSAARPNPAHAALAELEQRGVVAGVITQNVDGLHGAAGSRAVVELHGALARVRCLDCAALTPRDALQARLLAANPGWLERTRSAASAARRRVGTPTAPPAGRGTEPPVGSIAPDGDADLPDDLVDGFTVVACEACGGTVMPDVVFFGGSVPRTTLDAAWALFDRAEALLVVGSSLSVFSGFRFVRRAAERGVPIGILNRGPTRGDDHAAVRLDARAGVALPALARAL